MYEFAPFIRCGGESRVDERGPIGWVSLAGELQRDRGWKETVGDFVEIVFTDRTLKASQSADGGAHPAAAVAVEGVRSTRVPPSPLPSR
jgi:hypothetical protein